MTSVEPFTATLPPDPAHLHTLRHDVASWLGQLGIDGEVRDSVVIATHEAVASAMMSPGQVFVDATSNEETVSVVVTSADGWRSPDDDLGGQRMRIVRELVENVSFERSGQPSLRFQKTL